jgi:quinol monooxygenase YgiN
MTFHPDRLPRFLNLFDESAEQIRAMPGCHSLELLQDLRYPNVLSTYSVWESEDHLNKYRSSEIFLSTWSKTKPWFAAPAQAWSHNSIRSFPQIPEKVTGVKG